MEQEKESYQTSSRNPKVTKGSIKDDQNRRDFTINAMSVRLNQNGFGEFIDPFNGLNDINTKIIRTPLDPVTTYSDDPLRMMRAIRFASTLDFTIEQLSLKAIKEQKNRLNIIKQKELLKSLIKLCYLKNHLLDLIFYLKQVY